MRWYKRGGRQAMVAGALGVVLVAGGGSAIGGAVASQHNPPDPTAAQAGTLGSSGAPRAASIERATVLARSDPVSIDIPAIDVNSKLIDVGLNSDETIQVPPLSQEPSEAAWYKYSATPGRPGPSIIEGHIDNDQGPAVFFHLGALKSGQKIYITLNDGTVTEFRVNGVRQYPKTRFPTRTIYGNINFAALRLLTCGGSFDSTTHHYLDNTVVFASLVSSYPSRPR